MLQYWETKTSNRTIKGIMLSKNYPRVLCYDVTPDNSPYSWERTIRDFYIIKPVYAKVRFTKLDYYIHAITSKEEKYLINNILEFNTHSQVINCIEDLTTDQKEYLLLQF